MLRKLFLVFIVCFSFIIGCASSPKGDYYQSPYDNAMEGNTEGYLELQETGYIKTETNNKVNVSLDSSTAAYSNNCRKIKEGSSISKDTVNNDDIMILYNMIQ